jgi:hypothetical protein
MAARLFRCLMVAILSRSRSEQQLCDSDCHIVCAQNASALAFDSHMGDSVRLGWRQSGQHAT